MTVDEESLRESQELVNAIMAATGIDYGKHLSLLAEKIWKNGHFKGNWDVTVLFNDDMRPIRAIEENEWDQSMDDDPSRPTWETMICSRPVYTWFADEID